jgi:hypothetical protein
MNKLVSIIGVALFFGVIYGYAHESPYFSNTFGSKSLFFRGLGIGVLVGLIGFFYLKNNATNALESFQIGAFSLFLGAFVFPFLAMFSNRLFAEKGPLSIKVIFQRDEPIRTGRFGISKGKLPEIDGFYTYFLRDGDIDRVRSKQQLFRGVEQGSEVELPVKKGFWGFEFVEID